MNQVDVHQDRLDGDVTTLGGQPLVNGGADAAAGTSDEWPATSETLL